MEIINNVLYGFSVSLAPANLFSCLVGVLLGTLVGVLPGLGTVATISLLLPITFKMSPVSSVIMLAGIYYGAQYGQLLPGPGLDASQAERRQGGLEVEQLLADGVWRAGVQPGLAIERKKSFGKFNCRFLHKHLLNCLTDGSVLYLGD